MRSVHSHDIAYATAIKRDVDVLIACEPNKKRVSSNNWIKDKKSDVAVLFINKRIEVLNVTMEEGYICIELRKCRIYCCYSSPNISLDRFKANLDGVMEDSRKTDGETIILGDLNVKSPQWGSDVTDPRGEYLMEWLAATDMTTLNTGETPTFSRGNSVSFIDVTCATANIAKKINKWQVLEEESLSDHRFIYFEIEDQIHTKKGVEKEKPVYDWDCFRTTLEWRVKVANTLNAGSVAKECTQMLKETCGASQVHRSVKQKSLLPYWWSSEIELQRAKCIRSRRRLTRSNGDNDKNGENVIKEEYKKSKKKLKDLISRSKAKHWQSLCEELDNDIWGNGYKIVTGRLTNKLPVDLTFEKRREVAKELFPQSEHKIKAPLLISEVEPFTKKELLRAVENIKNGKAPGVDGIPPEAVKEAVKAVPDWMLFVFNELLRTQKFPVDWKVAKLILLPKGKSAMEGPSGYRPICLLNTLSKLYEVLIKSRLESELEVNGGFSDQQFGFRKGRSTIQAIEKVLKKRNRTEDKWCTLVTIDIKNAFNTASWTIIINELQSRGISQYLINLIYSYFEGRTIRVNKREEMEVTAGVPQGSVLGPLLWNILYDGVLRMELTEKAMSVGFADDLALVVTAANEDELLYGVNESLRRIKVWIEQHDLELAAQKTEAVIMKGPRKRKHLRFTIGGMEITPCKALRYLGVVIDEGGTFGEHLEKAVNKTEKKSAILARLMPNLGGPRTCKRMVLCGVVHSILLYGAPVWHTALQKNKYKMMLERTQRRILLRVVMAYRTVSAKAV
ncbi:uncharacterized protein LOC108917090 [Anoplophora glabripennis]|uniref:uncharacterized protein LOC108917090 n=1 Tax=Anoplophora glabripennis TaxID=217634 RepID=UPI000C766A7A|nr:uncharacterized protein LOC108917090 [Anoplophora glabripennis]